MGRKRRRNHNVHRDNEDWQDCANEPDMTTFYRVVANYETTILMSKDPIREYHKLVECYKPKNTKMTFWRNEYDNVFVDRWINNSPEIQGLSEDPIKPEDRLRVTYRDSIEILLRQGEWPQGIAKPYIPN